ncbi:MAG: hypothetical protein JO144_07840 [Actinobacteria bacterium]|nr:hypothetical protein [Actinomycetota bacterium]
MLVLPLHPAQLHLVCANVQFPQLAQVPHAVLGRVQMQFVLDVLDVVLDVQHKLGKLAWSG